MQIPDDMLKEVFEIWRLAQILDKKGVVGIKDEIERVLQKRGMVLPVDNLYSESSEDGVMWTGKDDWTTATLEVPLASLDFEENWISFQLTSEQMKDGFHAGTARIDISGIRG